LNLASDKKRALREADVHLSEDNVLDCLLIHLPLVEGGGYVPVCIASFLHYFRACGGELLYRCRFRT
jgi:hypothetical protein